MARGLGTWLILVIGIAAGVLVLASLFVCLGSVLALVFPLGLFHCTLLALGSTFFVVSTTGIFQIASAVKEAGRVARTDPWDEEEDDEEEDFLYPEEEEEHVIPRLRLRVGRNEPCPCGSGQKFKRCCGTAAP